MIKQRDYAGLMPNYQQLGAQQGQIWGGATQELFKALSQMLAQREADKYYGKFDVESTTPQQNVTTDLLGRPITQTTSGYGGMPVTSQVPAGRRDVTTTQTVDYSQDPQRLIAGLMNANPEIARRAQAGIQGIQLRQPNFQNIPEGGTAVDYNRLSPTYGSAIQGQKRQERFSTGFGDFVKANASKYADAQDPLSAMYNDYQNQQVEQFGRKEEIKSKFRAQKDGKSIGSYVREDNKKVVLWRNPDGTIGEIESVGNVKPSQESAMSQKEDVKISTLKELSKDIRNSAKPEYLGGFISGAAGQGFGGVLGGVREATGLISDDEAVFRANVNSLKNQLLYLRSGAQINEQEFKRLEKELPDPTLPENVFRSRLDAFDKQLDEIIRIKGGSTAPKQSTPRAGRFKIEKVE